jgi:hypothetical protein
VSRCLIASIPSPDGGCGKRWRIRAFMGFAVVSNGVLEGIASGPSRAS